MRILSVRTAVVLTLSATLHGADAQVWQNISGDVPGTVSIQNIRPMVTDGTRLYVLGKTGVFVSSDGGASFTAVNAVANASYTLDQDGHRFLRYVNGEIWLGSDPGSFAIQQNGGQATLHRLTPGSTTWTKSSSTGYTPADLGNQADDIAYNPTGANYISLSSFSGIRISDDGTNWMPAESQPGGSGIPATVVMLDGVAFTARPFSGIWKSTDGGNTWSPINTFPPTAGSESGRPGQLLVVNGRLMVNYSSTNASEAGFYYSDDLGESWTRVPQPGGLTALTTDGTIVYASEGNGVQFSANYGTTWESLPTEGLPEGFQNVYCTPHGDDLYLLGYTFDESFQAVHELYRLDVSAFDFTPTTQIAVEPRAKGLIVGDSHTLSVLAGGANLTYQWRKDGVDIPEADGSSFTLTDAALSDTGNYTVFVSGDKGDDTSVAVEVEVVERIQGRIDITYDKFAPATPDLFNTTHGGAIHVLNDQTLVTVNVDTLRQYGTDMTLGATADLGTINNYISFLDDQQRLVLGGIVSGSEHRVTRVLPETFEVDATFPPVNVTGVLRGVAEVPGRGYLLTGDFTAINGTPVGRIALVDYAGELQTTFGVGQTQNSSVSGGVVGADGRIYIFGIFSTWNGSPSSGMVRLDATGQLDTSFAPSGFSSPSAVFPLKDGRLLITTGLGTNRPFFALLSDGTKDAGFNTANATIREIYGFAQQLDGKIVLGGEFSTFNGAPVARYLRLNLDGTLDPTFDASAGFTNFSTGKDVLSVGYHPAGYIYLSSDNTNNSFQGRAGYGRGPVRIFTEITDLGIFRQSRGQRVDQNGSVTLSVAAVGTSTLGYQWYKNGDVLVGETGSTLTIDNYQPVDNGTYTVEITNASGTITSDPIELIAAGAPEFLTQPEAIDGLLGEAAELFVVADGAGSLTYQWRKNGADIPEATTASLDIGPLEFNDAGSYTVVVGNDLGSVESEPALVSVNEITGKVLTGFNAGGLNGIVRKLALFPDNSALLGGAFSLTGNQSHNWFTRMDDGGAFVEGWTNNPPGGVSGGIGVYEVAVLSNGKAIVAGQFSSVQGTAQTSIARINADGTLDTAFPVTAGPNSSINAVAELPNGQLLVGGQFNSWTGSTQQYLVRLNVNGTLDTTFTPSPNDWVYAIKVLDDGRAYVAGRFTQFGGLNHSRIVRLLADGSIDPAFTAPTVSWEIYDLDVDAEGRVVIGGGFTSVGGVSRNYLARLNPNGSLDAAFAPSNVTFNNLVNAVDVQLNGKIVVGGQFTSRLTRLRADGAADPYFQMTQGPNSTVQDVKTTPDGILWVGGSFTSIGGKSFSYVAAVTTDKADLAITGQPQSTSADLDSEATFSVDIYSATDATYQWFKDDVAIDGATSSSLMLTGLTRDDAGAYSVRVENETAVTTSAVATLAVLAEPVVTEQPASSSVVEGARVVLSVNAVGAGELEYQWRRNGEGITGANEASLTLDPVELADAGVYDVVISNSLGSLTSHAAGLGVYVAAGGVDAAFDPGVGPNSTITTAAVLPNGNVAVGGAFTQWNGEFSARFAVVDASGNRVSLTTNPGYNGTVQALATQDDGKVIVGRADGFERLNADGGFDDTFPSSTTDWVTRIVVRNGYAYLGGSFGSPFTALRRINLTTGLDDETFAANTAATGLQSITAIAFQDDGKIVAGTINALVKRLNADGTVDGTFTAPTAAGMKLSQVNAVAITDDGRVWVGGRASTFVANDHPYLVPLTSTGEIDDAISGAALNGEVRGLATLGNDVLVAGDLNLQLNDQSFRGFVRVSGATGLVDTTFGPVLGNFPAYDVVPAGAGRVYVVGGFDDPLSRIARVVTEADVEFNIDGSPGSQTVEFGEPVTFAVGWSGGANASYQWRMDGDDMAGETGQSLLIDAVQSADEGDYTVAVTVAGETLVSDIATLTVNGGGGGGDTFAGWKTQFTFPPGLDDPEDDADNDGLKNAVEFKFGFNPTEDTSGDLPSSTEVEENGEVYPAVTFIQSRSATGATVVVKVASTVDFDDELGFTQASVVDLGNGTERVTIRSNVSIDAQSRQFIKVDVTIP